MAPIIEVDRLTKSYGRVRGITGLSFQVDEGQVFGFLGPNGAGKTTTIRLLMALLRADSGRATVAGMDSWQRSVDIKRLVGYMPGEPALDPGMTGGQILAYFGHLRGGVERDYLEELIARFDFDPSRRFRQYSTGNKRKLVLIQAFMHRPRLLILDEPTSGLDPINQQEFHRLVADVKGAGTTVFLSSHVLSEVEHTCDRVAIIREGELVRVGGLAELKALQRRSVTITFKVPPPVGVFEAIAGVERVDAVEGGLALRIVVSGELDAVVKVAARYPVVGIASHEPSLEEIFLRYYQDAEHVVA